MAETLYERIAARLVAAGKSAREVSIAAGMGPDGIRDIKRGRHPAGRRLEALARELDCTVEELLGGTARRSPPPPETPSRIIPEVDGSTGAGLAAGALLESVTDEEGNTTSREASIGDWMLPEPYLTTELRVRTEAARIIAVIGDSMTPTLAPGDRVMVNTADCRPSPPGIFALWDGMGVVVKRVEYIAGSEPPAIRIISDNRHHTAYERTLDEAHLIGRIVWFARRM